MPTSFKDLELSHSQVSIIKHIKQLGKISKNEVKTNPDYQFLLFYSLLDNCLSDSNSYILSNKALMFLRYRSRNNFKTIYPIIISTLSLIISAIALIKSFI